MKEYYKTENGKLFCCDNISYLGTVADNTFDLTVTSPPYDNLRDYKGYSWDFEALTRELYRTTKEGGVVVWVVGDATINFCETGSSFKQALYFMECGFNLLDTMIYYKQNYAPAYPTMRRYANQFEYMFVFSKDKPKTFNPVQTIKIEHRNSWSGYRQKDGSKKRKFVVSNKKTKDSSNVWSYPVGSTDSNHPAVFPEKLAYDHIISWSNKDDIVFDPFMGSGTTAKMCEKSKRKWIGCEISKEYCEIVKVRVENERTQLKLSFV